MAPFEFKLSIHQTTSTTASVSWTPGYTVGCVLKQSPTLAPAAWENAATGNPLAVSTTEPGMFYRLELAKPNG